MKRGFLLSVLIVGLCLSLSPAHAIRLEYKVKVGDQWKQKQSIKGDGTMELGGMKIDMQMEIVTNISTKVDEVKADRSFVSTVDYKMETMKMTVNGMAIPSQPQPASKPIKVTTSKLGKPLKMEGLESGGQFGNIDFGKMISISPSQFPDKDVSVGETWDASPDPSVFPMKMSGKLVSLKNVGGKQVGEVEFTMKIAGEAFGKLVKQIAGMDIDISGPGMSGVMSSTVDVATGIQGSGKGSFEIDLTFVINNMQVRQVLKMDIVSDVTR